MKEAILQLLGSRKFIVLILSQLAILAPTVFGKLDPQVAAELGSTLVAVWTISHAVEEKSKIAAQASAATDAALAKVDS